MDGAQVMALVAARKAIYRAKHDAADPFADDIYNRWEATRYVVEAFECLETELATALGEREPERFFLT